MEPGAEAAKTLLLVDGNNLLFRSFFAMPRLTAKDGRPNGALHGFANTLKMLLREEAPAAGAAVFDAPGPTFRDDMFPEYKAQRPATPPELAGQMPSAREVARVLGVPPVEIPGVEADDVIGSLAVGGRDAGYRVLVVSGDKDLLQLVGEGITVLSPGRTDRAVARLDCAGVREKLGIDPAQVPDYLGLIGDSTDNIPGVPGVGPKTAIALLGALGNLEQVLARAAEVTRPRIVKLLAEHAETARLSRDLATLRLRVAGVPELGDLAFSGPDREAARELFESLDLRTHARDLAPRPAPEALPAVIEAGTASDVERWLANGTAPLAVHADFAAPEGRRPARIRALGLARSEGEAMLVAPDRVGLEELLPVLAAGLERIAIIGHAVQGFVRWLIEQGVPAPRVVHDSEVAIWLLETTRRAREFPDVLRDCTGLGIPEKSAQPGLFATPPSGPSPSLAIHAAWQHRLSRELESRLAAEGPPLQAIFSEMEMPLVPVLARMEDAGITLDPAPLRKLGKELGDRIATLTDRIHELSGGPFDLQSPKQLAHVLFDKLMLTPGKKTQRLRQASTRAEVLEQLALEHEVPRLVLEYRELAKLKNTYVDPLPELISPRTGRLHTRLHQTGAATGRLSSSDPNLQNIPIRTELGRRVRRAFTAPPGKRLIAADYSQIELRVLAHLSGDPGLIEAFRSGEDIHTRTAEAVFGGLGLPAAEARRRAKIINFSIIYGKTAFTLGREIGVPTGEAAAFIDAYFERHAGVRELIGRIVEDARKNGRVETLFGRQRHIPDIGAQHRQRRLAAERMAVNAPIQGTAADLIKFAMIRVDRALRDTGARLLLQIHDELLVEADEDEASQVGETVRREMESVAELRVPLVAEVTIAPFWEH